MTATTTIKRGHVYCYSCQLFDGKYSYCEKFTSQQVAEEYCAARNIRLLSGGDSSTTKDQARFIITSA